ncbi:PIN domain-containing protein [Reyranella sp.]|uniref:PIN domain-containing protein n=1 Tax=Reyranella sp. TaxID=1929291 RepID=UPI0040373F5F
MLRIMLDTNIWIDLAGNFKEQPLLLVLEQLVREGKAELIVPSIVRKEYEAKREGTERVAVQRATSAFANAKSIVELLGASEEKERVRDMLTDLGQKYPLMSEVPKFYVQRVRDLLESGRQLEPSTDVKVKAATRAMERQAPCHGNKNSINDAVIIEMYGELVRTGAPDDQFVFVSKNYHDFSAPNGNTTPHPDIVSYFVSPQAHYFIELPEALEAVAPEELEEANYQATGQPEPRTFSEISDAMDLLWDQIWYNRHKVYEKKITKGKVKLVETKKPADMFDPSTQSAEVWGMAQQAAQRVVDKRGLQNLGPWTDFEWGMLNGKLSALRWVLGDEWDFLDT